MGCDDYPHILDNTYRLGDTVAELWTPQMARRFPHTSHTTCFQAMRLVDGQTSPQPFIPPRCQDWHCPKCGRACNMYGHHDCAANKPAPRYWPDGTEMLLCVCGHPLHHHNGTGYGTVTGCGTVTVDGPPSPPDASAHIEHAGRRIGRCGCSGWQANP